MALTTPPPVRVELGGRSYDVLIGRRLLDDAIVQARDFIAPYAGRKVPVVADANARMHHGERLARSLASDGYEIAWYEVAPGEGSKSWESLARLTDWLLGLGITRSDHVFALGGGVVGDLVGFACSILKRGCGFVQIPTTLLSQVDSSVGGKTAINTAAGKNLIGAFHQPSLVLADTATLDTLPDREMRAGYAEVLKYGLLGDAAFFEWLEANGEKVLARDPEALNEAVATSIRAKARIVADDERETSGVRALLNLGHTFGHALEAATGYSDRLLHGEAVAVGCVLALELSARLGLCPQEEPSRLRAHLHAMGMPTALGRIAGDLPDCDRIVSLMAQDKKVLDGKMRFILSRGIGSAFIASGVPAAAVTRLLEDSLEDRL